MFVLTSYSYSLGEEGVFQEWTSIDGRVLEGRIVFRDGDSVRIERKDGREFLIPLDRFIEEDRERMRLWVPPEIMVPEPDNAVLVLETPTGRGSGFLVQEMGRVWVYTNQHVIGDAVNLNAFDINGEQVPLGDLELAVDRDLARFVTTVERGLKLAESGKTGDAIRVFGNSQGTGVITRDDGEILGISPLTIEVSSEIVSGNSGGPVLNEEGEAIGVSAFVKFGEYSSDATMEDTRYEKPRRFALRLDREIDFRKVSRDEFVETYKVFNNSTAVFDEGVALTSQILGDPFTRVMVGTIDSKELAEVAEDHNKDVAKFSALNYSGMPYRSKMKRVSGRLVDTLEDALGVCEESLKTAQFLFRDERFGWMSSELDRRQELLDRLKEVVVEVEDSF